MRAAFAICLLLTACTTPGVKWVCHPVPVDMHVEHEPGPQPLP